MKTRDAKLQRWIDLIAALASRHFGVTLADLKSLVPGYSGNQSDATFARMFERDKDELRALGIPIRVRTNDTEDGEEQRYYIKANELYLPYLKLAASAPRTRHVPPPGYRSLPTLVFEPDELSALIQAARNTKSIGVENLERDAASAIQNSHTTSALRSAPRSASLTTTPLASPNPPQHRRSRQSATHSSAARPSRSTTAR